MTPADLLLECQRATGLGHESMLLVIPSPRRRRSQNVRVLPGVMGRAIGEVRDGLLVDVKVADVMKALDKVAHLEAALAGVPR